MELDKQYSETVVMPLRWLLALPTLISSLITALLAWVMVAHSIQQYWDLLWLFTFSWFLLLVIFRLTKRVGIDVENQTQWSGQLGLTLVIRGNSRDAKTYIPFHLIENVTEVAYEGPWWNVSVTGGPAEVESVVTAQKKHGWRTFLSMRSDDDRVPVSTSGLTGYRGPGLSVTYRAVTPLRGGKQYLWRQQFPTRAPAQLSLMIESEAPPD